MPIATINAVLTVTPQDDIQIVLGEHDYKLVDDRRPFKMRVFDILQENGKIIGVAGPVIEGPSRYTNMVATLMTRLWDSQWETDMRTQAQFKIGQTCARRVMGFPHDHPEGTAIDIYPYIVRFGSVDAGA